MRLKFHNIIDNILTECYLKNMVFLQRNSADSCPAEIWCLYSATGTKNQLYSFFAFQNYVTEPQSDRSFKPSFQKDTCLFWLKLS